MFQPPRIKAEKGAAGSKDAPPGIYIHNHLFYS